MVRHTFGNDDIFLNMEIIRKKIFEEEKTISSLNMALIVTILIALVTLYISVYFLNLEWFTAFFFISWFTSPIIYNISKSLVSHKENVGRLTNYNASHIKTLNAIQANKVDYFLYLHSFHADDWYVDREPYSGPPVTEIIEINGRSKAITTTPKVSVTYKAPIQDIINLAHSENHWVVCLANLVDPLKDNPNIKFIIGDDNWKGIFKELSENASRIFYYISSSHNCLSESIVFELDYIENNVEISNFSITRGIVKKLPSILFLQPNFFQINTIIT